MGAIVLLFTVGEDFEWASINLFTVTCWLNWSQLVLIFFSSSLFFFIFFFISCAHPCGGQREFLTKYFSLNQAERKGGFQGQLQCKMPFITFIIPSISSALRREGFSMTPIMIQSLTQVFSIWACICSHSEVPNLPKCCFGDVSFWPLGNYSELHEFLHPSLLLLQPVVTICLMLC